MKVGRPGVLGARSQLMLASDGVREGGFCPEHTILAAREELRRNAVSETLLVHEDALIEDPEVGPTVAVEAAGNHTRDAHLIAPFDHGVHRCEVESSGKHGHDRWTLDAGDRNGEFPACT